MAYHVYKCNHVPTNGPDSGDWMYVFAKSPDGTWLRKAGTGWGRYVDHPELADLNPGDVVIALQTGTRKRLVGLAEYVGVTGSGVNRRAKLRPFELIDVKIPPLKKADPEASAASTHSRVASRRRFTPSRVPMRSCYSGLRGRRRRLRTPRLQ